LLRSALRWLRIDQTDQIAASLMCSCVVLARSDKRPAGAATDWRLDEMPGHRVAPEQQETSRRPQPLAPHTQPPTAILADAHCAVYRVRDTLCVLTSSRRDLRASQQTQRTARRQGTSTWTRSSTAKQGMQLEKSGVGGSSSTELRRHHLRQ
jgi:hypothetical protein